MAAPTTPQEALRVQKALVAVIWVSIGLLTGIGLLFLTRAHAVGWPVALAVLGVTAMFATIVASGLGPARSAADGFARHSVGDSGHHCQCFECGRTFAPHPVSPVGAPSTKVPPQQRSAAARSLTRSAPLAALFLVLGLVAAVIMEFAGLGQGLNLLFGAMLVAVAGLGLVVMVLVAGAQRRSTLREAASYPPTHGCTCRWCGRRT